eukprot:1260772-Pleurochrysis_carterae.AAC.1
MKPASEGLSAPKAGTRRHVNPIFSDSQDSLTTAGLRLLRQLKLEDRVRLVERSKGAHTFASCFGIVKHPRPGCVWAVELAGATHEAGQALKSGRKALVKQLRKHWLH